jgi:hypothetical protein
MGPPEGYVGVHSSDQARAGKRDVPSLQVAFRRDWYLFEIAEPEFSMSSDFLNSIRETLAGIEADGLMKRERLITSPQGGRIALLGIPPGKSPVDWSRIIFKAITIKGVYGREIFETWYKMIAMLENGLDVRGVITHRFKVDDFVQGFDAMRGGSSGKVVLDWT